MKLRQRKGQGWRLKLLAAAAVLLPLLLPSLPVPARASGGADEPSISDQAALAFWWGDFETLQRLHARVSAPGQRRPDGSVPTAEFRVGLRRVFSGSNGNDTDAYYNELEALTLQWAAEHPQSALAHALHARSLEAHGWAIRGSGYARTVQPEAMQAFSKYVQRAADYLAAHATVALTDATTHAYLLNIGRANGWDAAQLWAIAQDGLKRNPDEDELYFGVLTALLPKWGGSAVAIDRYVQEVVQRTRKERGMEFYARLYAAAADEEFEQQLFQQTGAEWPKVMAGYRDMLARWPNPLRRNRFAYMACVGRDKATLLDLMEQIGPKPDLTAWGSNPQRTFDACKRFASEQ